MGLLAKIRFPEPVSGASFSSRWHASFEIIVLRYPRYTLILRSNYSG